VHEPLASISPRYFRKDAVDSQQLRFIFDHGQPVELATCLPEGAYVVHPTGLAQQASREEFTELCQRKHGILVTANSEYASCSALT
jgi:hypothetical protein